MADLLVMSPTLHLRECVMVFNSGHRERWLEQMWKNENGDVQWRRVQQHLVPVPESMDRGY